jgi:hypothetical protein
VFENRNKGFAIHRGKGFHMKFANGYTVSVQFGVYNYCEHHSGPIDTLGKESLRVYWTSQDAEIAAWGPDGNWYRPEGWADDVQGWQTPEDVLAFMNEVASLPGKE